MSTRCISGDHRIYNNCDCASSDFKPRYWEWLSNSYPCNKVIKQEYFAIAGKDLPQMLRCSWQETVPVLETVPFEQGSNIPSQSAAYRETHDLDIFESTALSAEEALREAARLNAEKAISIAEQASSAAPKIDQGSAQPQKPAESFQEVPEWLQPASAMTKPPPPTPPLDARSAIEEQLLYGAAILPKQQQGPQSLPAKGDAFNANPQIASALQPPKMAPVMPEGKKDPPKEEPKPFSYRKKQNARHGQRGAFPFGKVGAHEMLQ